MAKLKSCDRDHRAGDGNYLSVSGHFQGGKMAKPCYKPRAHNHFVNNFYDMVRKLNVAVNDSCVCVCVCVRARATTLPHVQVGLRHPDDTRHLWISHLLK